MWSYESPPIRLDRSLSLVYPELPGGVAMTAAMWQDLPVETIKPQLTPVQTQADLIQSLAS